MTSKEEILYKLGEIETAKKSVDNTLTLVSSNQSDATTLLVVLCLEKLSKNLASAFNDAEAELMQIFKSMGERE